MNTHSNSILFDRVTKQFPGEARPAVDGASFVVQTGTLLVLLGPSGCGKTTLLKMVNRLYEPTSGQIMVEGREILSIPVTDLRRGIGYVIQQVGLFPHLTVERNIAVVPELLGWEKDRTQARIDELLNLVGLPLEYRKRYPRQLSGGEQQRVGLARALAADPDILLMDEPFAAIDAITRVRLQEELLNIQEKVHKTILFVTHDVEEALRLADQILVMQTGKVIQYGAPLEIIAHPATPFVSSLLGTDNVLRRLSLMDVSFLLQQENRAEPVEAVPATGNTVRLDDDLRTALAHLIGSGSRLTVLNDAGQPVGQIGLEDFHRVLQS